MKVVLFLTQIENPLPCFMHGDVLLSLGMAAWLFGQPSMKKLHHSSKKFLIQLEYFLPIC